MQEKQQRWSKEWFVKNFGEDDGMRLFIIDQIERIKVAVEMQGFEIRTGVDVLIELCCRTENM